jgi:malonate-semialdehyde dehydrogenase (acetylating)/methylmalonate-semialdehyde dehydrogenase
MAASAMVGIGEVDKIISAIVNEAKKITLGEDLGAVISKESKERIESYINDAEKAGAKILLDGRNSTVLGKENGYYVGPTVIDYVTEDMAIAKEEVFGPVLAIIRAKNLDEGIAIQNSSNYGNGASVFTQNARLSTEISERLKAGMIGVNIGVPVPREPFSFGGWDDSRFGVGDITGESSIGFWTQEKKITVKWNPDHKTDWMS